MSAFSSSVVGNSVLDALNSEIPIYELFRSASATILQRLMASSGGWFEGVDDVRALCNRFPRLPGYSKNSGWLKVSAPQLFQWLTALTYHT